MTNWQIRICFFLGILPIQLHGQNWLPLNDGVDHEVRSLYTDTANNVLIIGGSFKIADGDTIVGISSWNE